MSLRLDWCDHKAAKYAVEHWHYSGTLSSAANNYIGVWEGGTFIGAVVFGIGANNNAGKPYGLKGIEIAELTRVALTEHTAPVSKIVSVALKMVAKKNPGLKAVVSYADLNHDHVGTIYQAGNWIYVGTAADQGGSYVINGKVVHARTVSSKLGTRRISEVRRCLDPRATVYQSKGKHKYLYPLTDEMRTRIAPLRKPYPKRASVVQSAEHPANQPGNGGAIPTPTHPSDLVLDTGGAAT